MFSPDVFVVSAMRLLARLDQRAAYPVREIVPSQLSLLGVGLKFLFPGNIASICIPLLPLGAPGRITSG